MDRILRIATCFLLAGILAIQVLILLKKSSPIRTPLPVWVMNNPTVQIDDIIPVEVINDVSVWKIINSPSVWIENTPISVQVENSSWEAIPVKIQ